ncbi:MAG: PhoH family protein [Clostridia bacterium]|nr:PhoH family protein [Clostridia bacterium]
MSVQDEVRIAIGSNSEAFNLLGNHDKNLEFIEKHLEAKIVVRGNEIVITGEQEEVLNGEVLFKQLLALSRAGQIIDSRTINYILGLIEDKQLKKGVVLADFLSRPIHANYRGKKIKPRTVGQYKYVEAIKKHELVFGIGPAGTGKTYLAVVMAVKALRDKQVERIVLARPAVEAGEKLGFLPGDLQEKVNPYLRPLYDGLYDVLGVDTAEKYMERNIIEIAPLAYMRGRTLSDSFIILDEAQNTTPEQMKMFLTRIGLGSKAVITGDITQVDLPKGDYSGLIQARDILGDVDGIAFEMLTEKDVVRHPLVQKVILAYEGYKPSTSGGDLNGKGWEEQRK